MFVQIPLAINYHTDNFKHVLDRLSITFPSIFGLISNIQGVVFFNICNGRMLFLSFPMVRIWGFRPDDSPALVVAFFVNVEVRLARVNLDVFKLTVFSEQPINHGGRPPECRPPGKYNSRSKIRGPRKCRPPRR